VRAPPSSVGQDSPSPPHYSNLHRHCRRKQSGRSGMAGRYDSNPFEEEDVNPFSEQARGKAGGQSNFGGGAFYMPNPRNVAPASNSRLSPLPPEPADFSTTVDIPLDSSKDLKRREKELQAREAELNKREKELKRRRRLQHELVLSLRRKTGLLSCHSSIMISPMRYQVTFKECNILHLHRFLGWFAACSGTS